MRHLAENFHKKFKHPDLTMLLWEAARTITATAFDEAMIKMGQISEDARKWLLDTAPPQHWAELYFPGKRYGHYTSNIAESLNSSILQARELPILPMFESLRHQLMNWFIERRQMETNTQGILVREASNKIQTLVNNKSRRYQFWTTNNAQYEVRSNHGQTLHEYKLWLDDRACTCNQWQANGYPCAHALAIILFRKEDPQAYAEQFLTLDAFRQTYSNDIYHPQSDEPMVPLSVELLPPPEAELNGLVDSDESDIEEPDEPDVENPVEPDVENPDEPDVENPDESEEHTEDDDKDILPPTIRRQPGRPANARKEAAKRRDKHAKKKGGEVRAFRCGLCGGMGHSKRTCKEPAN